MAAFEGTVELDEAAAPSVCVPSGTRRLRIGNPSSRAVDSAVLTEALMGQVGRRSVTQLDILWTSKLTTLRVVRALPGLEGVSCESTAVEDLRELVSLEKLRSRGLSSGGVPARSLAVLPHLRLRDLDVQVWKNSDVKFIGGCGRRLERLWLRKWTQSDFEPVSGLSLRELVVIGGSATSSIGVRCNRMGSVKFKGCRRLRLLQSLETPRLDLDGCSQLDLATIGQVEGLRDLKIKLVGKYLPTLAFLRDCATLESISVTAGIPDDVRPLSDCKSLRFAWLPLTTARLVDIARQNPALLLGNGQVSARAGELLPNSVFYEEVNAYFRTLREGLTDDETVHEV